MADFVDITELSLGTTFGGWYAKNNIMIQRLNALNVANIVGGDGITASPHTAANGGYTLSLSGNVTRDMVFNNVTVNGTLTSNFAGDISGTTIVLPANTGVTVGNIVYVDSTGKAQKALADDECTAEVVGIVTGFTGDNVQVATTGRISGSSIISSFTGTPGATLQKGVVYFLSGGVSGAGTTLEPDVTLYVSKPMLLGLTGDSGLILPYRGFIATEGTLGNTTIVQGVSGGSFDGVFNGVLSVNGLTASLYLGTDNEANRKTTGHIHAVNNIKYGDNNVFGNLTKSLNINPETPSYPYTTSGVFQVPAIYGKSIKTVGSGQSGFEHITKHTPDNKIYLSTLGTLDDVYRLHQIRITHINGEKPVRTNFVINKFYNNIAASNWTSEFERGETPVEGEWTQTYTEYRMKNVALISANMDGGGDVNNRNFLQFEQLGVGTLAPDQFTQSNYINAFGLGSSRWSSIVSTITPTTDIMTPVIRLPYGTTLSGSLGITASTAIGGLSSSGVYPTTYIKNDYNLSWSRDISIRNERHRVYGWKFNSVILTGSIISGYINTIAHAALFDVADTNGYTLDTSILGWNATTGPIPETVSIAFPSIDNYYASNNTPGQFGISTILEVYKYNPTTGVTGPIIMIQKDFRYFTTTSSITGYDSTEIGQS